MEEEEEEGIICESGITEEDKEGKCFRFFGFGKKPYCHTGKLGFHGPIFKNASRLVSLFFYF